ncbi:hypothetical protein, partial [Verrucomicrobium spinosum]|uniref:hypothetical protein n=1 Tax=Verrucomicrobium spinosum TaxID=2736 RepID=UPI001C463C53
DGSGRHLDRRCRLFLSAGGEKAGQKEGANSSAEGVGQTMVIGKCWDHFVPAKRHRDDGRVHSDLVSETS